MICYYHEHKLWTREILHEVEVGNAIADRAEKGRTILHEDKVALLVDSPHEIGELQVRNAVPDAVPGSLTSSKQRFNGRAMLGGT
jgi:urease gamma subunit